MTISPTTEAIKFPLLSKTAHSISRPATAFSIITFRSYVNASLRADSSSLADFTLCVPRLEPPRAGLTKHG